ADEKSEVKSDGNYIVAKPTYAPQRTSVRHENDGLRIFFLCRPILKVRHAARQGGPMPDPLQAGSITSATRRSGSPSCLYSLVAVWRIHVRSRYIRSMPWICRVTCSLNTSATLGGT